MKILQVLSQTELTGSEIYAQKLVEHLEAKGHELTILSDQFHVDFRGHCHTFAFNGSKKFLKFAVTRRLRGFLKTHSFDVIHCHSRLAAKFISNAKPRGLKVPVITTLHGIQHASLSKKLFNSYGDQVIAVCENLKKDLLQKTNLSSSQILLLPNPISVQRGPHPPKPAQPDISPRIIFAGRNSGPKGATLRALLHSQMESWVKKMRQVKFDCYLHGLREDSFFAEYLRVFPSVSISGKPVSLIEEFQKNEGCVVVASGRTAVEAALAGCQVLSLGEAGYQGRLTRENLALHLASNFGDMGDVPELDELRLTEDLQAALEAPFDPDLHNQLRQYFLPEKIFTEIEELYFSERLRKVISAVPILMYHRVTERELQTQHRTFVTEQNFRKHLAFYRRHNRTPLSFTDLKDFWFAHRPLKEFPKNPIILTFDDGYRDLIERAAPALRDYHMKATVFLLSNTDYQSNTWDDAAEGELSPLLSREERQKLDPQIFELGSHGHDHLDFTQLGDSEILDQMKKSKTLLEQEFSRPIETFAYPFGRIDSRLPQICRQAGYAFAVNTDRGPEAFFSDRFSLFRVNIFPEESAFSLWKKTLPFYHKRQFRKQQIRERSGHCT